jgi:hypothetical protein
VAAAPKWGLFRSSSPLLAPCVPSWVHSLELCPALVGGAFYSRRLLLANAAIAAYLALRRRGFLVRPSHSSIADWMACRSASGIPADPSASASGQPWRLRGRCFGGAEDSERGRRAIISDNLAGRTRCSSFQLRATSGRLHWSLQCPFVAERRW